MKILFLLLFACSLDSSISYPVGSVSGNLNDKFPRAKGLQRSHVDHGPFLEAWFNDDDDYDEDDGEFNTVTMTTNLKLAPLNSASILSGGAGSSGGGGDEGAKIETVQEEKMYISKLFSALSNEMSNVTGGKNNVEDLEIQKATKPSIVPASILPRADKARFENLIILSLLKPARVRTTTSTDSMTVAMATEVPGFASGSKDFESIDLDLATTNQHQLLPEKENVATMVILDDPDWTPHMGAVWQVMRPKLMALLKEFKSVEGQISNS